ncbi:protein apterous [Condylostylus longicornis]|uniref:protein apterous n=1 Tax=Condylostylus longicornis TaxID=2530218 RepID=UPI00244DFA08|nr:protein apterous [Condylostylus longicornis]XP_055373945.1 protein apterous [Condylostylus longicornis]XP_055373946.1 protein apterous [Condylostylus longicornis]XP_055373947.1 protein apterous [Condylostylus longicornis]XP_055373948.1 protein apterous [Condylostylus longicornis]XP_055373949.1 protein apterous [Condylostylus longicornis]
MGIHVAENPEMDWGTKVERPCKETSPASPIRGISENNGHSIRHVCLSCADTCEHNLRDSCELLQDNYNRNALSETFTHGRTNPEYLDYITKKSEKRHPESLLKIETCATTSSPESSSEQSDYENCAGCGRFIQDRFYLSAVEKRWHASCLQCCICRRPLEQDTSCFQRDDNIYCKNDYYRVFGSRRCSKCLASISSSELVMRVRYLVFHLSCFSCTICNSPLTKGDEFGIRNSDVFCRLHYIIPVIGGHLSNSNPFTNTCSFISHMESTGNESRYLDGTDKLSPSDIYIHSPQILQELTQPPRQKGRPRKRKPKDFDTLNSDLGSEYLEFNQGGSLSSASRTKRMRTSFKHHQLRTMKSYFAINHNPDAKDLKQLSQKTGLPKRVLQVWFQNARAKWRRMMTKQDTKNVADKFDGSTDIESFNPNSPSFFHAPPSPSTSI